MFNIVLHEPEIPPNTGNIIRLCANTGFSLHLIEPIGFSLNEKALRRAGLDYHEAAMVEVHATLDACFNALHAHQQQVFACSTRGQSNHVDAAYAPGDLLLFGAETRGLPTAVLDDVRVTATLRIPMQPGSRSLNLSNAVSVVAFEAWRQHAFAGSQERLQHL
jgi:tRNA (cytidine/uridine-2'-O-)-methyltransferase